MFNSEVKGATPLAPASAVFNFLKHRNALDEPEMPESKDNFTNDIVRADFVRSRHNNTHAT